jgi:hypothetical protein
VKETADPYRLPGTPAIARAVEGLLSPRALALIFLLACLALAIGPWLRPPLAVDIRGAAIPLNGALSPVPSSVETPVSGSIGGLLSVLVALGALAVVWEPRLLKSVAGCLLTVAIACNMSLVANNPQAFERFHHQEAQRLEVAELLERAEPGALTKPNNGRTSGRAHSDESDLGCLDDARYLTRGIWLAPLAALALLAAVPGSVGRRLGYLAVYSCLGLALGTALSWRRVVGEIAWLDAKDHAARCEFELVSQSLDRAGQAFPGLLDQERSWLLVGRIDQELNRSSDKREYFLAQQALHQNEYHRAIALLQKEADGDLARYALSRGLTRQGVHSLEVHDRALHDVPFFAEFARLPARSSAACALWWRAIETDTDEALAARLMLGEALANIDFSPMSTIGLLQPIASLPDRALRADVLDTLGDARFRAGRFDDARESYEQSMKAFMLPKIINYRGQRGLGGL